MTAEHVEITKLKKKIEDQGLLIKALTEVVNHQEKRKLYWKEIAEELEARIANALI